LIYQSHTFPARFVLLLLLLPQFVFDDLLGRLGHSLYLVHGQLYVCGVGRVDREKLHIQLRVRRVDDLRQVYILLELQDSKVL
jgi:hypothetical protein